MEPPQNANTAYSSKQLLKSNKYAGLTDMLIKNLVKKGENKEITNTKIGSKEHNIYAGSYSISDSEYNIFLNHYAKSMLNPSKKEYLTEKQLVNNSPLVVDIDFRFDYDVDERQYTKEHIDDLIDSYLDIFKSIYQLDSNTSFSVYVQQKPTVNRIKEKNCTKDGIHILFGLRTERATQQIIRNRIISEASDMWSDLNITNTFEDVFDKGITDGTVNWQLYGSRKPNHERYKLSYIYEITYDDQDDEFMRSELPLSSFNLVNDIYKLSVRNQENPSLLYKSSFITQLEEFKRVNELKAGNRGNSPRALIRVPSIVNIEDVNISSIRNADELNSVLNNFLDNINQIDYDLKDSYEYVMILPESYYGEGSYQKWIRVGWCLRNISNNLLIVWIAFSAKSSTFNYSDIPNLCERWKTFDPSSPNGITKRSLYHWAKNESTEEYENIRRNSLDYHVEQTLKIGGNTSRSGNKDEREGCGDYDLATVLYHRFKDSYVCVSVKGNLWMEYKNHRWFEVDQGTTLRKAISNQLRELYRNKAVQYMNKANDGRKIINDEIDPVAEQDDFSKLISQRIFNITKRLANTTDKNNIMKEAKELFYDGEFIDKLDTNPYLLCFKNGVFDFRDQKFRRGIPEDNISKSTNIIYQELNLLRDQLIIDQINDFMSKLFPEKELLEYMWDHLASTLMGTSTNQTFNNYIGQGQNGKSVLVNLMEIVLGDYKGDVPLSAVTDRRGKVGGLAPEIVQLKGTRYAVMQEPKKGDIINEGIMKQLTSGKDPIQARAPYMLKTISFIPQFKLVVTCNVFLQVQSNDWGTWRRIRAVPFKSLFTENPVENDKEKPYQFKLDKSIDEKFDSWKEVFMAMLVERACKTNGIVNDCSIVMEKTNQYRKSQDYISEFADDCVIRSDKSKFISKSELNNEFVRWHDTNYGGRGPSPRDLHEFMDRTYGNCKGSKWYGVSIKYEDADEDESYNIISNNTNDIDMKQL